MLREEAPIIPEKVRAGEIVRDSPTEEYNQIKRSIAKAKKDIRLPKRGIRRTKVRH